MYIFVYLFRSILIYLSKLYSFIYVIYYMHIRRRERKKGNKKRSTMGIICEIDTVNSFSLPFHYILVCQSRNLMALTAHHFQDVFNNPH